MSELQDLVNKNIPIKPVNDTSSVFVKDDTGVHTLEEVLEDIQSDVDVIKNTSGGQAILDLDSIKQEISNARESNTSLDERLDNIDSEILNLKNSSSSATVDDYGTF